MTNDRCWGHHRLIDVSVGLVVCWLLNRWQNIEMRPYSGESENQSLSDDELPPLGMALFPVVLPVLLIAANTIVSAIGSVDDPSWQPLLSVTGILGNPSLALILSAAISIFLVIRYRRSSISSMSESIEQALMGGGIVILITAAGGAFGKMLAAAGIQETIQSMLGKESSVGGLTVLFAAFGVASMIKFAQGSGTVSMITTSSMFGAIGIYQ